MRPLIRFQMRFLYDVLHLVEYLSSVQGKYFHTNLAEETQAQAAMEEAPLGAAGTEVDAGHSGSSGRCKHTLEVPLDFQVRSPWLFWSHRCRVTTGPPCGESRHCRML